MLLFLLSLAVVAFILGIEFFYGLFFDYSAAQTVYFLAAFFLFPVIWILSSLIYLIKKGIKNNKVFTAYFVFFSALYACLAAAFVIGFKMFS